MEETRMKKDWANAPLKSGSKTRPYRFNCRCNPSERAQLMEILHWIKTDVLKDESAHECECLIKGVLALQHLRRHTIWGDRQQRVYARQFFEPLDRSDYLVERGKRMIRRGILKQAHFDAESPKAN